MAGHPVSFERIQTVLRISGNLLRYDCGDCTTIINFRTNEATTLSKKAKTVKEMQAHNSDQLATTLEQTPRLMSIPHIPQQTILGHRCQHLVLTEQLGQTTTSHYDILASTDLGYGAPKHWLFTINGPIGIDSKVGLPLRYFRITSNGESITLIATSVVTNKIDGSLFDVPAGYMLLKK